jgi:hypothetical protein
MMIPDPMGAPESSTTVPAVAIGALTYRTHRLADAARAKLEATGGSLRFARYLPPQYDATMRGVPFDDTTIGWLRGLPIGALRIDDAPTASTPAPSFDGVPMVMCMEFHNVPLTNQALQQLVRENQHLYVIDLRGTHVTFRTAMYLESDYPGVLIMHEPLGRRRWSAPQPGGARSPCRAGRGRRHRGAMRAGSPLRPGLVRRSAR